MPRRRKSSPLLTLTMWCVAAALIAWGIWQATLFRRTLIAENPPATTGPRTIEQTSPLPTTPSPNTSLAPEFVPPALTGSQQWSKATTPAVAETEPDLLDPTPATSQNADVLLTLGCAMLEDGRIVEGRNTLNAALAIMPESDRRQQLRNQLADLNESVFLGTAVLPDDPAARFVDLHEGDSFLKLGQQYAVPAALLEAINPSLNPRNLKPGTGVKIIQGPFHLRLQKSANRVDLFARDLYVRSFPAEILPGDYLPSGIYRVASACKIQVNRRCWIGIEGISETTADVTLGWLHGEAGPRKTSADLRVSGLKMRDSDLALLYNVLVETRSLLRVEP